MIYFKLKCDRCGRQIKEGEEFNHQGQTLCDDCYIDIGFKVKACDPWAVRLATRTRESAGATAADGLSEQQKAIYEFVVSKGKTTGAEVSETLRIPVDELERQFATLRHCELLKGKKEGDKVYIVPFSLP